MDRVEWKRARWLAFALLLAGLVPSTGCRICADCEDLAYPAYGGAWQRTRRNSGRVASIFDPAGVKASELVNRDDPPDPDELERERQESRRGDTSEPDASEDEPPQRRRNFDEKSDELEDRKLDDIDGGEGEEELRQRRLDDINIRLMPGKPLLKTLE